MAILPVSMASKRKNQKNVPESDIGRNQWYQRFLEFRDLPFSGCPLNYWRIKGGHHGPSPLPQVQQTTIGNDGQNRSHRVALSQMRQGRPDEDRNSQVGGKPARASRIEARGPCSIRRRNTARHWRPLECGPPNAILLTDGFGYRSAFQCLAKIVDRLLGLSALPGLHVVDQDPSGFPYGI
jgi:hypothetical protein